MVNSLKLWSTNGDNRMQELGYNIIWRHSHHACANTVSADKSKEYLCDGIQGKSGRLVVPFQNEEDKLMAIISASAAQPCPRPRFKLTDGPIYLHW